MTAHTCHLPSASPFVLCGRVSSFSHRNTQPSEHTHRLALFQVWRCSSSFSFVSCLLSRLSPVTATQAVTLDFFSRVYPHHCVLCHSSLSIFSLYCRPLPAATARGRGAAALHRLLSRTHHGASGVFFGRLCCAGNLSVCGNLMLITLATLSLLAFSVARVCLCVRFCFGYLWW